VLEGWQDSASPKNAFEWTATGARDQTNSWSTPRPPRDSGPNDERIHRGGEGERKRAVTITKRDSRTGNGKQESGRTQANPGSAW